MNRYITVHTLKKPAAEFADWFNGVAMDFAEATTSGVTPARCLTTWNGVPHGQEYVFCLWEAENPDDIATSLGEVLDWVTLDAKQVDEVQWAELAQVAANS